MPPWCTAIFSGQWLGVSGQWSVVSGQWLVVSGQWLVVSDQESHVNANSSFYLHLVLQIIKAARRQSPVYGHHVLL